MPESFSETKLKGCFNAFIKSQEASLEPPSIIQTSKSLYH
jgi:hypothetical protein